MKAVAGITLASEAEIQELNRRYRHRNRPTDVLSFPLDDFNPGPDGVVRLGDIVICESQAKKKHHPLAFLIRHAMLHLLGVHHK